ncbi:hypothetical protein [Streptomyces sp. NPDC059165]|uniref:hypothetical protein n=1 Tax=Streptomyces sp. NPDC059165 TaxID=3346751 RepID=UPI00369B0B71
MSKPTAAAAVLVVALAAPGTAGCGTGGGPHVQGPAPSADRNTKPVYVSDTMGNPLSRPTGFGITEHASLSELRWRAWGEERVTATGRVSGPWCLPDCSDSGYPASVELTGLEGRENVAYYTHAVVRSSHLPVEQAAELHDLRLPVPN